MAGEISDMLDVIERICKRARNETLDEVISKMKPGEKPCDCITLQRYGEDMFYAAECNCLNTGDLSMASMWCESANIILAIEKMKEE